MNIIGNRVVLRAIEEYDNKMLMNLVNDMETEMAVGGMSFPISSKQQNDWFMSLKDSDKELRCIIADKEDQKIALGTIILSDIDYKNGTAELHIKMDADKGRNKGYGTDAVNTINDYAFNELRLNCIYANVLESNDVSNKLFRKCGFSLDGTLRSRVYKNGSYQDVKAYSVINKGLF